LNWIFHYKIHLMVRFSAFHQDRGCLSRFFPLDRWGKRAPFLLTHCIIAATAASVVYMPPSTSSLRSLEMGAGISPTRAGDINGLVLRKAARKSPIELVNQDFPFWVFPLTNPLRIGL
jgi:hypothetical protein